MPFLLIPLAALIAVAIGSYRAFVFASTRIGTPLAALGAVIIAAALVALIASRMLAYRAIHGTRRAGNPSHLLESAWGRLTLFAADGHGRIETPEQRENFTFGDIEATDVMTEGGKWGVSLRLKHADPAVWQLPMDNRREARKWRKIFSLAAQQKL